MLRQRGRKHKGLENTLQHILELFAGVGSILGLFQVLEDGLKPLACVLTVLHLKERTQRQVKMLLMVFERFNCFS